MKTEKLNFLGYFSIKPRCVTNQIKVLQRVQHSYDVRMTNLYILKACSDIYAYNLCEIKIM